jgi:hypothetical protein
MAVRLESQDREFREEYLVAEDLNDTFTHILTIIEG